MSRIKENNNNKNLKNNYNKQGQNVEKNFKRKNYNCEKSQPKKQILKIFFKNKRRRIKKNKLNRLQIKFLFRKKRFFSLFQNISIDYHNLMIFVWWKKKINFEDLDNFLFT